MPGNFGLVFPVTGALGTLAGTTPQADQPDRWPRPTPLASAAANPVTNQVLSNSSVVGGWVTRSTLGSTFSSGLGAFLLDG